MKGSFVTADCWLAAENLMLAAPAYGLGTCVIGFAVPALADLELRADLGIPPEVLVVAPIIVGVPAATPAPTWRKPPNPGLALTTAMVAAVGACGRRPAAR